MYTSDEQKDVDYSAMKYTVVATCKTTLLPSFAPHSPSLTSPSKVKSNVDDLVALNDGRKNDTKRPCHLNLGLLSKKRAGT